MNGRQQQGHFTEYAVVVDTNILLAHPRVEAIEWGVTPITVFILESVLHQELAGLRRNHNPSVAQRAREAFEHLTALEQQMEDGGYAVPGGQLRIVPTPAHLPTPLEPNDVDQQQIGMAYLWMQEQADRFCAIVTRDRAMHDIAISARPPVPVVTPGSGNLPWEIREQLQRLIKWTGVWPRPAALDRETSEATAATPPNRFEESALQLYQRIQSAGYRAIVAAPPLAMRLAVAARLVQELTESRQSVVFLHAPDRRSAEQ